MWHYWYNASFTIKFMYGNLERKSLERSRSEDYKWIKYLPWMQWNHESVHSSPTLNTKEQWCVLQSECRTQARLIWVVSLTVCRNTGEESYPGCPPWHCLTKQKTARSYSTRSCYPCHLQQKVYIVSNAITALFWPTVLRFPFHD